MAAEEHTLVLESPVGRKQEQIRTSHCRQLPTQEAIRGQTVTSAQQPAGGLKQKWTYRWRNRAVGEVGVRQHQERIPRVRRRLVHASILVLRH